jgi:CheY-like chemotaxis protein
MDLLVETSPDLVLLDLLMPEQTGVSLYSKIVRHPLIRQRPIVIMSGLGERAEISEIVARAGDVPPPTAILEKPIELRALMAIVDAQLFGDDPEDSMPSQASKPAATGGGS